MAGDKQQYITYIFQPLSDAGYAWFSIRLWIEQQRQRRPPPIKLKPEKGSKQRAAACSRLWKDIPNGAYGAGRGRESRDRSSETGRHSELKNACPSDAHIRLYA
jgi:hypothetical protein